MIKDGVYSAVKLKLYVFFKYLVEKLSKTSNFPQIMLFIGL